VLEVATSELPLAKLPPSTVTTGDRSLHARVPDPFVVKAYPFVPAVVGNVNV
jgi:hypothetical protein